MSEAKGPMRAFRRRHSFAGKPAFGQADRNRNFSINDPNLKLAEPSPRFFAYGMAVVIGGAIIGAIIALFNGPCNFLSDPCSITLKKTEGPIVREFRFEVPRSVSVDRSTSGFVAKINAKAADWIEIDVRVNFHMLDLLMNGDSRNRYEAMPRNEFGLVKWPNRIGAMDYYMADERVTARGGLRIVTGVQCHPTKVESSWCQIDAPYDDTIMASIRFHHSRFPEWRQVREDGLRHIASWYRP